MDVIKFILDYIEQNELRKIENVGYAMFPDTNIISYTSSPVEVPCIDYIEYEEEKEVLIDKIEIEKFCQGENISLQQFFEDALKYKNTEHEIEIEHELPEDEDEDEIDEPDVKIRIVDIYQTVDDALYLKIEFEEL